MSNITLRIADATGHTELVNLSESQVREQISAVQGENWVFVDGLMIGREELSNIEIADNATVLLTPSVIGGRA